VKFFIFLIFANGVDFFLFSIRNKKIWEEILPKFVSLCV
jgi:hypothetical protein